MTLHVIPCQPDGTGYHCTCWAGGARCCWCADDISEAAAEAAIEAGERPAWCPEA